MAFSATHQILRNPSETSADGHDLARFDTDEVGPWSAWIGARPAKLLLVGQDWGTVAYYLENEGRDAPRILANVRLLDRLAEIGVYDPDLEWGNAFRIPVFLTNAVLCLKTTDSMAGPVRARCLWNCHPFLRATVRVTGAEAIVAMGQAACAALFGAFGARLPQPFAEVIEEGAPIELPGPPPIFAVYHPSVRPVNRDLEARGAIGRGSATACAGAASSAHPVRRASARPSFDDVVHAEVPARPPAAGQDVEGQTG